MMHQLQRAMEIPEEIIMRVIIMQELITMTTLMEIVMGAIITMQIANNPKLEQLP